MKQYRRRAANLWLRTELASLEADPAMRDDIGAIARQYDDREIGHQDAELAARDRRRDAMNRARLATILRRLNMPPEAAQVATDDEVRQIIDFAHRPDDTDLDQRHQTAFALLDDIRRRYRAQE